MNVKETEPGVMIVGQSRIGMIIIGAILAIGGIFILITNISTFNASNGESWIGPVLLLIGGGAILLWKSKKTTFDKNKNMMIYESKSVFNKQEKTYRLDEIKEIGYQESITRTANNQGTKTQVTKIVKLSINNGETYDLIVTQGGYNPFINRTKDKAQKIADFLGMPLKSLSVGDVLNELKNTLRTNF